MRWSSIAVLFLSTFMTFWPVYSIPNGVNKFERDDIQCQLYTITQHCSSIIRGRGIGSVTGTNVKNVGGEWFVTYHVVSNLDSGIRELQVAIQNRETEYIILDSKTQPGYAGIDTTDFYYTTKIIPYSVNGLLCDYSTTYGILLTYFTVSGLYYYGTGCNTEGYDASPQVCWDPTSYFNPECITSTVSLSSTSSSNVTLSTSSSSSSGLSTISSSSTSSLVSSSTSSSAASTSSSPPGVPGKYAVSQQCSPPLNPDFSTKPPGSITVTNVQYVNCMWLVTYHVVVEQTLANSPLFLLSINGITTIWNNYRPHDGWEGLNPYDFTFSWIVTPTPGDDSGRLCDFSPDSGYGIELIYSMRDSGVITTMTYSTGCDSSNTSPEVCWDVDLSCYTSSSSSVSSSSSSSASSSTYSSVSSVSSGLSLGSSAVSSSSTSSSISSSTSATSITASSSGSSSLSSSASSSPSSGLSSSSSSASSSTSSSISSSTSSATSITASSSGSSSLSSSASSSPSSGFSSASSSASSSTSSSISSSTSSSAASASSSPPGVPGKYAVSQQCSPPLNPDFSTKPPGSITVTNVQYVNCLWLLTYHVVVEQTLANSPLFQLSIGDSYLIWNGYMPHDQWEGVNPYDFTFSLILTPTPGDDSGRLCDFSPDSGYGIELIYRMRDSGVTTEMIYSTGCDSSNTSPEVCWDVDLSCYTSSSSSASSTSSSLSTSSASSTTTTSISSFSLVTSSGPSSTLPSPSSPSSTGCLGDEEYDVYPVCPVFTKKNLGDDLEPGRDILKRLAPPSPIGTITATKATLSNGQWYVTYHVQVDESLQQSDIVTLSIVVPNDQTYVLISGNIVQSDFTDLNANNFYFTAKITPSTQFVQELCDFSSSSGFGIKVIFNTVYGLEFDYSTGCLGPNTSPQLCWLLNESTCVISSSSTSASISTSSSSSSSSSVVSSFTSITASSSGSSSLSSSASSSSSASTSSSSSSSGTSNISSSGSTSSSGTSTVSSSTSSSAPSSGTSAVSSFTTSSASSSASSLLSSPGSTSAPSTSTTSVSSFSLATSSGPSSTLPSPSSPSSTGCLGDEEYDVYQVCPVSNKRSLGGDLVSVESERGILKRMGPPTPGGQITATKATFSNGQWYVTYHVQVDESLQQSDIVTLSIVVPNDKTYVLINNNIVQSDFTDLNANDFYFIAKITPSTLYLQELCDFSYSSGFGIKVIFNTVYSLEYDYSTGCLGSNTSPRLCWLLNESTCIISSSSTSTGISASSASSSSSNVASSSTSITASSSGSSSLSSSASSSPSSGLSSSSSSASSASSSSSNVASSSTSITASSSGSSSLSSSTSSSPSSASSSTYSSVSSVSSGLSLGSSAVSSSSTSSSISSSTSSATASASSSPPGVPGKHAVSQQCIPPLNPDFSTKPPGSITVTDVQYVDCEWLVTYHVVIEQTDANSPLFQLSIDDSYLIWNNYEPHDGWEGVNPYDFSITWIMTPTPGDDSGRLCDFSPDSGYGFEVVYTTRVSGVTTKMTYSTGCDSSNTSPEVCWDVDLSCYTSSSTSASSTSSSLSTFSASGITTNSISSLSLSTHSGPSSTSFSPAVPSSTGCTGYNEYEITPTCFVGPAKRDRNLDFKSDSVGKDLFGRVITPTTITATKVIFDKSSWYVTYHIELGAPYENSEFQYFTVDVPDDQTYQLIDNYVVQSGYDGLNIEDFYFTAKITPSSGAPNYLCDTAPGSSYGIMVTYKTEFGSEISFSTGCTESSSSSQVCWNLEQATCIVSSNSLSSSSASTSSSSSSSGTSTVSSSGSASTSSSSSSSGTSNTSGSAPSSASSSTSISSSGSTLSSATSPAPSSTSSSSPASISTSSTSFGISSSNGMPLTSSTSSTSSLSTGSNSSGFKSLSTARGSSTGGSGTSSSTDISASASGDSSSSSFYDPGSSSSFYDPGTSISSGSTILSTSTSLSSSFVSHSDLISSAGTSSLSSSFSINWNSTISQTKSSSTPSSSLSEQSSLSASSAKTSSEANSLTQISTVLSSTTSRITTSSAKPAETTPLLSSHTWTAINSESLVSKGSKSYESPSITGSISSKPTIVTKSKSSSNSEESAESPIATSTISKGIEVSLSSSVVSKQLLESSSKEDKESSGIVNTTPATLQTNGLSDSVAYSISASQELITAKPASTVTFTTVVTSGTKVITLTDVTTVPCVESSDFVASQSPQIPESQQSQSAPTERVNSGFNGADRSGSSSNRSVGTGTIVSAGSSGFGGSIGPTNIAGSSATIRGSSTAAKISEPTTSLQQSNGLNKLSVSTGLLFASLLILVL